MALLLDSIYRPFNEFFYQKFGVGGAPLSFRFARLPRAFVDSDFLASLHPESGPSPAIAQELLSTVVDGVTRLDADGRTVWLITSRLSELYNDEMLAPAIPFVPVDVTDEAERQARIDAFNNTKADAIKLWQQIKAMSLLEGVGVEYRPSTAMPGKWWDRTDPSVWTHQSFHIEGAATSPGQPVAPRDRLLRMKVDDSVLRSVLESHVVAAAEPEAPKALAHPMETLRRPTLVMARRAFTDALANDRARTEIVPATPRVEETMIWHRPPTKVAIYNDLKPRVDALPFRQRMEIESLIAYKAESEPVATSDATISFDYCVATVTRPWLHNAFVNNVSWRIPGKSKGELSANDGHGLPALPVGFVAVKGLRIEAPWTSDDIANLERSVQFGPFNFDSRVTNGAIGHDGIQIVGWMLQGLPDLPPQAVA